MRNAEIMVVKPHPVAMIQTPSGVYILFKFRYGETLFY